jgi:hypothetical protein
MATAKKHKFLLDRKIPGAWLVLRIDDYNIGTAARGQFYPETNRLDDTQKAIWGSESDALAAAAWATRTYGHEYGVFKMTHVVGRTETPVKTVKV